MVEHGSNQHMTKVTHKSAAKSAAKQAIRSGHTRLRQLPEWNLDDLYSGLDDPAIKRDLERTDADCAAFEDAYKGKLAALAAAAGAAALAAAIPRSAAIRDLIGPLGSCAAPAHAGDTVS